MDMLRDKERSSVAADLEQLETVRIDCYMRPDVPAVIADTITGVINRLQALCDSGIIADYEVNHWPLDHHVTDETDATRGPTRHELVAKFERWAEQHGYTLKPAFRREEISVSPLGIGCDDPYKRIRVPVIALALYEEDSEPEMETAELRGVVPYTEHPDTDDERTYTVDEWLSAVETKKSDVRTRTSRHDQATQLEGQQ
ncbi:HTH domain-containing protein [Natrinema soli]|uniref:HTH domain-containing protein n=2 Tax=Natrinema soli TaxID=1930624 RepID=A0ABD5SWC6_9EURY